MATPSRLRFRLGPEAPFPQSATFNPVGGTITVVFSQPVDLVDNSPGNWNLNVRTVTGASNPSALVLLTTTGVGTPTLLDYSGAPTALVDDVTGVPVANFVGFPIV